jgi:hypothetical protein
MILAVHAAVAMKSNIVWDVTMYSLVEYVILNTEERVKKQQTEC